jgi:hypothetical protein
MSTGQALSALLLWLIYPLWLIAGAVDWFCHRGTHIETTSGSTESWLHLAQFLCVAAFLVAALLPPFGVAALVAAAAALLVHTVLSYVDVRYTLEHRYISSLEQHVHGFLDVLPWMAYALWIVMNLQREAARSNAWHMSSRGTLMLLGSYAVLAGAPIIVELRRTLRSRSLTVRG